MPGAGSSLDGVALRVQASDYHTAGEPFRIVTGGVPPLQGTTVLERRRDAAERFDDVRKLLVNEPRGHADMYGCHVVPPNDEGADLGVVFFHNDGYSTACGHGTIALATWAVEAGRVEAREPETTVVVDVPSGRVTATVAVTGGRASSVRFRNVPSYVEALGVAIGGGVEADISFGGAFYASVEAHALGLTVAASDLPSLIEHGRRIKHAIESERAVVHAVEPELRDIYGVIFWQHEPAVDGVLCLRNVTVFADGEVDRSPCGSGTSARLALLDAAGTLPRGAPLHHLSIIGTAFTGRVVDVAQVAGRDAVITEIVGSAYPCGSAEYVLAADDPLGTGFLLR